MKRRLTFRTDFFFFILFEFHPVAFITYSKKKKKQIRYFENVSVRKFITP